MDNLLQRNGDGWIELGARTPLDLRDGLVGRAPGPVGAVAADGMERVGAEDDPAAERNIGSLDAIRVSRAVPALVRMAHEAADLRELGDGAQDLLADERV